MNCVDYLLQDHQERSGDFILGRGATLTYPKLIDGVLKLSSWLETTIGRGRNVMLMMPNSAHSVISYLAIMKSGNVVVPLNPTIEAEGFNDIVGRCKSVLLITSVQLRKRLNPQIETIVTESEIDFVINTDELATWQHSAIEPDALAQIIFTSGSTAKPKGVMISHKNIIANTSSIIEYLQLTEDDIIEIVLPFFYCYGLSLLHTHLKVGGSVVLNNTFIFLSSVLDDFQKYKCTGFAGVPSHFQILLRKSDSFKNTVFSHLRYVTQAGGKLHTTFIKEFCESQPDIRFIVMYGQTEATARLSYLPVERLSDKLGSLGKGIPNVELRVVNSEGEKVKPGEIGEIIAQGDNVMLGYYNEPEETASTIRDNWLYTGDLAKVDEDGFIYHAARKKEIIKVGGRRVSPKEIEEVIVGIDGVIDCSIEAVEDELLGEAIKAILVINTTKNNITEELVKQYCASKLANYKVPQLVEFIDKLNINSTGKKVKA
ncbi:AMP-binding protein [Carboxylicivirga sp. A043]|uniref:class I adenylate-forming enzyme family protein n=1 Tax=Carboxylicivirga litoralis TaxID=2816963 RepID=UPI0021CAFC5E|nr:AMP-binding protein [Carboxylicivirga sp. A043]MCU4155373.1 AMP-binding protein [Carboxylicivirga sp. A043]